MNLQSVKQRFGIIGNSPALNHALKTAVQVAPTNLTVLITGQSGVGKESFSKIIHALSPRKHRKFIAINCGAIPEGTINSELFGHVKGAFTGSAGERKGYFETVNGGTIFLDEIGEMPLKTQVFLLRILEQGEFIKVGGSAVEKTNVRIVAATNVNLLEKVRQGKFREDLYYRLNTVPIRVPSLKERGVDVQLLFRKFASDFAERHNIPIIRLEDKAQLLLENYTWPGNIRELKNIAEQVSALSEDRFISANELLKFMPNVLERNLTVIENKNHQLAKPSSKTTHGFYEREILYKFLYDMKRDLSDVKRLIVELAKTNNLRMPVELPSRMNTTEASASIFESNAERYSSESKYDADLKDLNTVESSTSLIIKAPVTNSVSDSSSINQKKYNEIEEIEESLSLQEMEQKMIRKALKRYKGRRREAADELGISERTLYRKIRQYNMNNELKDSAPPRDV